MLHAPPASARRSQCLDPWCRQLLQCWRSLYLYRQARQHPAYRADHPFRAHPERFGQGRMRWSIEQTIRKLRDQVGRLSGCSTTRNHHVHSGRKTAFGQGSDGWNPLALRSCRQVDERGYYGYARSATQPSGGGAVVPPSVVKKAVLPCSPGARPHAPLDGPTSS